MTSITKFNAPDFEEYRINIGLYERGVTALAPPVPAGMGLVLNGGGASKDIDHPIHPMHGFVCQLLRGYSDKELIPLYMVYFGQIKENGRRVKIEVVCKDLGIASKTTFYEIAHRTARDLWRRAGIMRRRMAAGV